MPVKRVAASNASSKTLHRRALRVEEMRETINLDVEDELTVMPRERRDALLKQSVPLTISVDHALAIKSMLSISWNKLRKLRRYLTCNSSI